MNSKLWNLLRRNRLDREIAEELATHAALLEDANRADGTHRRLGSDLALRERTRAADVPVWLDELLRDFGFAERSLGRNRGFTLTAVLTLALGIGATTAMFSVVNTVLLHPLPFPHAERLVSVRMFANWQGKRRFINNVPTPILQAVARSHAFAGVGLIGYDNDTVSVDGTARDAYVSLASPHLFRTLGVRLELGHRFSGAGGEALVSDRFWRTQLGGTPAALGKSIRVGQQPFTVAGVVPAGEAYPPHTSVWIEGTPEPDATGQAIARLPGGVPLLQARARAQAAITVIGKRQASTLRQWGAAGLALVPPLQQLAPAPARTALWVLLAAVACLLLIACANTANLLLGRGLARQQEFAVRRALGASRMRLVRLLLAEGLWLALASALAGAGLAWVLIRLARVGPASVPRLSAVRLDPAVLALAAAIGVVAGLACALAPALRLSRGRVVERQAHRMRQALVIGEVALTLVLLTGGVLLLRSFGKLLATNPGFTVRQMTDIGVTAPDLVTNQSRRIVWPQRSRTFQALLARTQVLPGVVSVTYANHPPFTSTNGVYLRLPGAPKQVERATDKIEIGPGYFAAMGVPLLAGRSFTSAEETQFPGKSLSVVVNAALARQFWPGEIPAAAVGKRLLEGNSPDIIVGVVGDTRDNDDLTAEARPQLYYPCYGNFNQVEFLLRSPLSPATLARDMQRLLPQVSSALILTQPQTLDAALATALAQPRFRTVLLILFAALAWLLALVGIYGVLAYQVRQRRREIGIRMALGAEPHAITRLVLRQSLAVLAAGIGGGWLLSWYSAHFLRSLLYGVDAFDPLSWLAAAVAVLAAGIAASFIPARRARRVDAAETLRCE